MSQVNYEQLIALVKQQPALYDHSHPAHCNRDVTTRLWSQIAAELDTKDIHCKTKWATLRSNFVREIRRMRPSEDGSIWPPQWPLFKPLMFLLPFLKTRGSGGLPIADETVLGVLETYDSTKRHHDDLPEQPKQKKLCINVPAEEEENDDKLFMLSLVPKMRLLPNEENLNFRIEVQQLLLEKLRHLNQPVEDDTLEGISVKVETFGSVDHLGGFQIDQT
ncbi:uncharacterized protein LOC128994116 [Macrosteles quadrilineatus]|uniref:uncharacterized protein LOC128994116 n=1 Tax=Macrosteles quadrilineatus TaxID=74068 RepID=UPI0023E27992|nr:uncharacterized protein LOC128994116 [Macrosteles quadrilineatus]